MSTDDTEFGDVGDVAEATATEIRDAVVSGRVSATEVTEAVLARIERVDAELHSFITVTADRALAEAWECDRLLAVGRHVPGPLFGVPYSVKDCLHTTEGPTTAGSLLFADSSHARDSLTIRRLAAAGASLVGKTNLPEFASLPRAINRLGPETVNPWDHGRIAGGSSGGSAASVAAGLTPFSLGTDAGGSNRIPAAFCGVFTMHPTLGRIPQAGAYRSNPFLTGTAPLSRSVRDAAVVFDVLSPPSAEDPLSLRHPAPAAVEAVRRGPSDTVRLRWFADSGLPERLEPAVVSHVEQTCRSSTVLGNNLVDAEGSLGADLFVEDFGTFLNTDRLVQMGPYWERPDRDRWVTDYVDGILASVHDLPATVYARAARRRLEAVQHLEELLDGVDALVTPTVGLVAPSRDEPTVTTPTTVFTFLANYAGFPAVSVPCGMVDGLPVSAQILGRRESEADLFAIAGAVQREWGTSTLAPAR